MSSIITVSVWETGYPFYKLRCPVSLFPSFSSQIQ
jgi:hypothetical protein